MTVVLSLAPTMASAVDSKVGVVEDDFMTTDVSSLGTFEVVFYLGVIYHVRHPLSAMGQLGQVTSGSAFIESEAAIFGGLEDIAACQFFEADECGSALPGMCRSEGFGQAKLLVGPPPVVVHPRTPSG